MGGMVFTTSDYEFKNARSLGRRRGGGIVKKKENIIS